MNEIAIAYRLQENCQVADKNFGIVLNPHNRELGSFSNADLIIVLSED